MFYDGSLVFSKLETGLSPNLGQIVSLVLQKHELNGGVVRWT